MGKRSFEVVDDKMVEILKAKTPRERLEISFAMWRSARVLLLSVLTGE